MSRSPSSWPTLEARLADGLLIASAVRSPEGDYRLSTASSVAYLAYIAGDDELLARAQAWADEDPPPRVRVLVAYLRVFAALVRGEDTLAAELAGETWDGLLQNGAIVGLFAPVAMSALVRDGRVDEAEARLTQWSEQVDALGAFPAHATFRDQWRTIVSVARGRYDDAWESAHAMCEQAHASGLVLPTIDALLLLADLADIRGQAVTAARLAGAARAARARTGYRRPLRVEPLSADRLASRLAGEHAEAFAEGERMALSDAVELVQRSRGERGRPTSGWDSLTPTERRVADLVAEGLTNGAVAERLIMSEATVKTHLTRIYAKLAVANRTELAALGSSLLTASGGADWVGGWGPRGAARRPPLRPCPRRRGPRRGLAARPRLARCRRSRRPASRRRLCSPIWPAWPAHDTAVRLFGEAAAERTRDRLRRPLSPDPDAVEALAAALRREEPDAWASLTPTEQRVAAAVAEVTATTKPPTSSS